MLTNSAIRMLARARPSLETWAMKALRPHQETRHDLFGELEFTTDLGLGMLQRYLYLYPERFEPETQSYLRSVVEPGMTALDIGANAGFFTVLLASLTGPTGRVIAFEPYAPLFNLLEKNIRANEFDWVDARQLALSNERGSAMLTINPANDGGNSLGDLSGNPDLKGHLAEDLMVEVETATLDAFMKEEAIGRADIIKIDVEGAEHLAIEGARESLIATDAPTIVCEVGEAAQQQFGQTERELRELLYSLGYKSFRLDENMTEFSSDSPVEGLINVVFKKEHS